MFAIRGTRAGYTVGLCREKGWGVRASCDACDRVADVDLTALPASTTLATIAGLLVCRCGGHSGLLFTRQADAGVTPRMTP